MIYHFGPDLALLIYIFQYLALFTYIYPHLALFGYIDRQAGWCVHYWHCVFIRCVGGYSLYVILKLLGWDGVSVLRTGRERAGGGGGEVEFLTEKKISAKTM